MAKTTFKKGCALCASRPGTAFDEEITMAFQPIFDAANGTLFAQEALVRGKDGKGAGEIFELVTDDNRYRFDQLCRTTAIRVATELGIDTKLSINFMPNAVYEPRHCISHTLWAADKYDFDVSRIIFEFTDTELIRDIAHLKDIIETYRVIGFRTAIDDFGAGFSGLNLLADVVPDLIKLDRHLIVNLDKDPVRRAIVRRTKDLCDDLGVDVVAEGIETAAEFDALRDLGISLLQGYYLSRPKFEALQTTADCPLR
ncbi:MAG: EAL domain-containing protein [Pseudomonadota bacterium]